MDGGASLAVSLSTNVIKLYDRSTLQCKATLRGHQAPINDLHPSAVAPHTLYSCSSDGTLVVWDCRTGEAASTITVPGAELHSVTAGMGDALVVVGMEARAVFYDSKTGAELGDYTQSHTDTITQVGNTV
jgi:WD40 repeat protein